MQRLRQKVTLPPNHPYEQARARREAEAQAATQGAQEAHIKHLRHLAAEYSARSAQALFKLTRQLKVPASKKDVDEALKTSVPKQTLAPAPRSLGKSAAEGPGSRLQADLLDFNLNADGSKNANHRYGLLVSDVFSRRAFAEPLENKTNEQVNEAMREILARVPGHGQDAVISTDKGREFSRLDQVLPKSAAHREKQGVNDLAVVDRTMQALKRDLEGKAQNFGHGWAHNLSDAADHYNFVYKSAVHGPPEKVGEANPQTFFVLQDNAEKFWHNRNLTARRKEGLMSAGAFREPIDNGGRSFKPNYGPVRQLTKHAIQPGAGEIKVRGHSSLFKTALPVATGSGEPLAHITFPPRSRQEAAPGTPKPPEPSAPGTPPQRFFEGGSSSSGGANPARFSEAQLRRQDVISRHIMSYQPKRTAEQNAQEAARKRAAEAEKERKKSERLQAQVNKELAKQQRELEAFLKRRK